MLVSDWSSDVCSSDLYAEAAGGLRVGRREPRAATREGAVVGPGGTRGAVVASVPLEVGRASCRERRWVARGAVGRERDDSGVLQGQAARASGAGELV